MNFSPKQPTVFMAYMAYITCFKSYRIIDFFYCYLAAPQSTLGHYRGDSLTHPMLITEGYQESRNEVGP